jgi:hypothetical protein
MVCYSIRRVKPKDSFDLLPFYTTVSDFHPSWLLCLHGECTRFGQMSKGRHRGFWGDIAGPPSAPNIFPFDLQNNINLPTWWEKGVGFMMTMLGAVSV